ncbi:MAG: response regulator transcription factor [Chloroflexota bacterium]|nr:response regulator transcription factor [Chloroflexota bacterium]
MMRILLVEDHAAVRQSLAFILGLEPDLEVVGQAGTLAEARGQLEGVDVAVIDLHLPDGNGAELIRELHAASPRARALVLSASQDRRELARAVEAGASGLVHKAAPLDEIVGAIRCLGAGEQLLSPAEMLELLRMATQEREQGQQAQAVLGRLTPREREVLQAAAEGLQDKEIAQQLELSALTVRRHMENILGKLGVGSRLQAVLLAARHGLVELP